MPLSDAEIRTIAEAIAVAVPEDLLVQVAVAQAHVPTLAQLRKTADDPSQGRLFALARAILVEYNKLELAHELLVALYRKIDWSPSFSQSVSRFAVPPDLDAGNLQALHRRRDHFISSPNLLRFTREIEPRVCWIVGEYLKNNQIKPIGGTGFLVAPALILTAAHVFEDAIATMGTARIPQHCAVFFDYVEEPEIRQASDRRNDIRRVALATEWHVESSPSLADDGLVVPATQDRLKALAEHLDFALIQLAEPVGLETVASAGGGRRGWIALPEANLPLLGQDSYVNIAQHPHGTPRQLGFGRYTRPCPSGTRFWYDTEADKGASGSPCLTRDLELVGIHNAEYNPPDEPVRFNQAVRIDLIAAKIRGAVTTAIASQPLPPPAPIWNAAAPGAGYRLIFGRDVLLSWLERAAADPALRRSDRLYAADASQSGSGKTFSIEILRSALGRRPEQKLVAFGTEEELLPARVEDMIQVMGDQLGVPIAKLAQMPARPQADLPSAAPDGDKLRRWASETVPRWFAKVLEETRPARRDARAEATRKVAELRAAGQAVPADLVALAEQPEPVWIEDGWRVAWIALDGLVQSRLSGELRDLIAGLTGAAEEETAMPPILRRLRWLFLGYRPDFVAQGHITVEVLDPTAIGAAEAMAPLRNAWVSRGVPISETRLEEFRGFFGQMASIIDMDAQLAVRLDRLQRVLGGIVTSFLPEGFRQ